VSFRLLPKEERFYDDFVALAEEIRRGASIQQLIERDRKVAHAFAGRVIDRVGDRCCNTDDADLAQALDAERVDDASGSSTKITLMSCTSAFTGTWYSAILAFMTRPKL